VYLTHAAGACGSGAAFKSMKDWWCSNDLEHEKQAVSDGADGVCRVGGYPDPGQRPLPLADSIRAGGSGCVDGVGFMEATHIKKPCMVQGYPRG